MHRACRATGRRALRPRPPQRVRVACVARSPFVVHLKPAMVQLAKDYQAKGVKVVAISSNSAETHPKVRPVTAASVGAQGTVPGSQAQGALVTDDDCPPTPSHAGRTRHDGGRRQGAGLPIPLSVRPDPGKHSLPPCMLCSQALPAPAPVQQRHWLGRAACPLLSTNSRRTWPRRTPWPGERKLDGGATCTTT